MKKPKLERVIHRSVDPQHTNVRPQRTLVGVFNGDQDLPAWLRGRQLKVLELREADFLGRQGHYHEYGEFYYVFRGEVTFDLLDFLHPDKSSTRRIIFPGEILVIPARVAHRAYGKQGTILIALTEKPYQEGADIPCSFEPVGELPYGLS